MADFGLSRIIGNEDIQTKTHGTVSHMPPGAVTSCCAFAQACLTPEVHASLAALHITMQRMGEARACTS